MRVGQLGKSLDVLDFAALRQQSGSTGEPLDDAVLERAQLVQIDRRLAEGHAPRVRVTGFAEQTGDVQQRFGGNAAAIHADAARIGLRIDDRGLEPEIRGEERGGVPAGAATHDNHLSGDHCSESRNGCSNTSATQRRKRAPSAPSTARWSYDSASGI